MGRVHRAYGDPFGRERTERGHATESRTLVRKRTILLPSRAPVRLQPLPRGAVFIIFMKAL